MSNWKCRANRCGDHPGERLQSTKIYAAAASVRAHAFDLRILALLFALLIGITLPGLVRDVLPIDFASLEGPGYALLFAIGMIGGATLFMPVPSLPFAFVGASILEPGIVALAVAGGMTTGMALTYLAGAASRSRIEGSVVRGDNAIARLAMFVGGWMTRKSLLSSFVLAVVPNPVYDFAGLIAGSSRVPFPRFVLGVLLGKSVQASMVAAAGFLLAGALPSFV